ncbi:serine-threonine protein kinase, putative [Entamoeba dispar SAW760]|uniref:Serine-threonine protein kinase, putative n=1 Tax=Entamoeba dispar (strain ATCC PRA-260 / SAW760) TaxID=370354 RepID=B0EMZ2_ENTDS|nr:serine-threonine protein kinase, putative [Entamoeba dispar SAW760]EDR24116.1 serine-threonine protein kinase, putative [Entamoeba dispar SAW760]|eukprot:EDR24116.1 serine-threonine protein kinase, putative [Entamoeba dispar SAW760]
MKLLVCLSLIIFSFGIVVNKTKKIKLYSETKQNTCQKEQCSIPYIPQTSFDCSNEASPSDLLSKGEFIIDDLIETMDFYGTTIDLIGSLNKDAFSPPSFIVVKVNNKPVRFGVINEEYLKNRSEECCMRRYSESTTDSIVRRGKNIFSIESQSNVICISSIEIKFNYGIQLPDIIILTPSCGPIEGNTTIQVFGNNFKEEGEQYYCWFGSEKSKFDVINSTFGNCLSPNINKIHSYQFHVGYEDDGNVKSNIEFEYYNCSIIKAENQNYQEKQIIMVNGNGFIDTKSIYCKLEETNYSKPLPIILKAEYIDQNTIICQINNMDEIKNKKYFLSISLNNVDYIKYNTSILIKPEIQYCNIEWIIVVIILIITIIILLSIVIIGVLFIKKQAQQESVDQTISTKEIVCDKIIGRGSFGDVWSASWKGQEIAVKLIPIERVEKKNIEEVTKEVKLMKSLRHPCVLQFFGSGMDNNFMLIAMELMQNGTVREILNNNCINLTIENKLRMLKDTASGMFYLHHCKPPILHRDLKTNNLLVNDNWCVKVSDFGLSTPLLGKEINPTNLCGTLAWIAPEILQNKPFGIKSDVYSFGIVMWEILTRKRPYSKLTPYQIMLNVSQKGSRPKIPKTVENNEITKKYIRLMERCWDELPESRPLFDEIIDILTDLIEMTKFC